MLFFYTSMGENTTFVPVRKPLHIPMLYNFWEKVRSCNILKINVASKLKLQKIYNMGRFYVIENRQNQIECCIFSAITKKMQHCEVVLEENAEHIAFS